MKNRTRLSGAIADTDAGREVNHLAPAVTLLSEQPYTSREGRRHARTESGAIVNVAKDKQKPALNEPYCKPIGQVQA